jgi:hypothetical protein
MSEESIFKKLYAINVNDKVEKKANLTYLSWSFAWAEVKKLYPNATYSIFTNENNLPYVYDEKTGYMVYTQVTIDGLTHDMWLPVLDGAGRCLKAISYQVLGTKWVAGSKQEVAITIEPATMFDINKTLMRCLTKNLAMFGLGLYIYAGEDIPEGANEVVADAPTETAPETRTPARALIELKLDTENWEKAKSFIEANKQMGIEKILQQLKRKYIIGASVSKSIAKILNS